ncbi:MAG: ribulose-phosphate 3-epimerase [Deltaproteobacteria bacterium]|nr:ribulose-phosphate 3-epimerase [Deltaproteobacteria bacterium]
MRTLVAPSILSADFGRLAEEIASVEAAGADWIHVDVMDGRFVPNLTIGPVVVAAARRATRLPLDVHLMIEDPTRYVADFRAAGADWITIHAETCPHLHRAVQAVKETGARVGVALNPHTPESVLDYVLADLDLVLCMSVNPGFGGQTFIRSALEKVASLTEWIRVAGLGTLVAVDGGVKPANAGLLRDAGAGVLVAGTAVFGAPDRAAAILAIRGER